MLDLSTGICPRSWPVRSELVNPAEWHDLPQQVDETALHDAFRRHAGIPDDAAILTAPGSQLLISLVPLLGKKGPVAIPDPAYAEHEAAWMRHGYTITRYPAGSNPLSASTGPDRTSPASNSFIAVQPGNPVGEVLSPGVLLEASEKAADAGGIVVVDEAFADLDPSISLLPHAGRRGLIIFRSLGKFYGLGGLRLGLAAGHADDIASLAGLMGPWAVSTPALRVGAAALGDTAFQDDQRAWIRARHDELISVLDRHQLTLAGGTGLYALISHDDAAGLHHHLAREGIWTRIFSYNPAWLRLGLPDQAGLGKLDDALSSLPFAHGRNRSINVASD